MQQFSYHNGFVAEERFPIPLLMHHTFLCSTYLGPSVFFSCIGYPLLDIFKKNFAVDCPEKIFKYNDLRG